MQAFNLEVHAHLIAAGYTFAFREADFEDVGSDETGPILHGGPDEKRDLAWENWIDEQYGVQG